MSRDNEVDRHSCVSRDREVDRHSRVSRDKEFDRMDEERQRYLKRKEEEMRIAEYKRREEENRIRELRKREEINNSKRKYTTHDPMLYNKSFKTEDDNPYSYYKSFNKKPVDFRRENNISESSSDDDVDDSSTEYSDSSSDGFPSPRSPRKRDSYRKENHKSYNELYNKVQELQRRMAEMETSAKRKR
jgi:hypothetical protein